MFLLDCLKRIYPEVALWIVLTIASAIFFAFSYGTQYRPLANGLLITSAALLVATTLFELLWQAFADAFSRRRPAAGNRHR
jgi:hypothetical protein